MHLSGMRSVVCASVCEAGCEGYQEFILKDGNVESTFKL